MNTSMDIDEELIALSPVEKATPSTGRNNTSEETSISSPHRNPPAIRRPGLQHQHSFVGHEESFDNNGNNNNSNSNNNGHIHRAPSGRPFLATRHLSMEEISHSHHHTSSSSFPEASFSSWMNHPSSLDYSSQYQNDSHNHSHSSFLYAEDPNETIRSIRSNPGGDDEQRQSPPPNSSSSQEHDELDEQEEEEECEETPEDRARREEEESIALAQQLMAEEAMASHRMSADFLRMNSDQFSTEDFEALQNALREEEETEYDEEAAGDGDGDGEVEEQDLSYETLLQLGERIGDVKTDRWTMIAHKEIAKLQTFHYDPDKIDKNNHNHNNSNKDIDDSEIKCLVCQFAYEKGDHLRRLPCSHCFHKDCIDQWLQTKDICAYCRQSIVKKDEDERKAA